MLYILYYIIYHNYNSTCNITLDQESCDINVINAWMTSLKPQWCVASSTLQHWKFCSLYNSTNRYSKEVVKDGA